MKRTPLEELLEGVGSYVVPSDPAHLMWDFYCLYALCYRYGGLWNEYHEKQFGPNPIHPPVYARVEQWVNDAFFSVKEKIKSLMLQWIPLVCLSEAFHFLKYTRDIDDAMIVPSMIQPEDGNYRTAVKAIPFNELREMVGNFLSTYVKLHSSAEHNLLSIMLAYAIQTGGVSSTTGRLFFGSKPQGVPGTKGPRLTNPAKYIAQAHGGDESPVTIQHFVNQYLGGQIDMAAVRDVFLMNWNDAYGGTAWYHVANLVLSLQKAAKAKDDVFFIDQIYDAHHNTGTLLSKVAPLYVPGRMLDIRATLNDPREFEPYVSYHCRRILTAFERFLKADVERAGRSDAVAAEKLEVVRPVPQVWVAARLEQQTVHTATSHSTIWYMEPIKVGGDVTIGDYEVKGRLLLGLQEVVEKFGDNTSFLVLPKETLSPIERYIPITSVTYPLVAALTAKGWKLSCPGFACHNQIWPKGVFQATEVEPVGENCSVIERDLTLHV